MSAVKNIAMGPGMRLFFFELTSIGLVGTIAFYNLWMGYVFGHVGGLGILGLLGSWAGHIASKKGYGYRRAFWACFASSIIFGVVSVGIVWGLGGGGCGGIVSIAVAIVVIVFYALAKRKRGGMRDHSAKEAGGRMPMKKFASVLIIIVGIAAFAFPQKGDIILLAGPYLGQKPPGMTPEIFAPGIVSTGLDELNSVFSPDGSEFYFCVRNINGAVSIFQMTMKDGVWSGPRLLPFASRFGDIDVSISPAGDALLFSSRRPLPGSQGPRPDNDFWLAARKGETWADPVHLGSGINSDSHDYYPVMTGKGAIYFSSQREGPGKNDIYRSERINGAYMEAVKIGDAINTEYREYDPYISPAEDMLIFTSEKPEGFGRGDLYISFRDRDGNWIKAVNMGENINSPGPEFCPMLSPDGKYLFFTSARFAGDRFPERPFLFNDFMAAHNLPANGLCDIYWVDAGIIEALRPKH